MGAPDAAALAADLARLIGPRVRDVDAAVLEYLGSVLCDTLSEGGDGHEAVGDLLQIGALTSAEIGERKMGGNAVPTLVDPELYARDAAKIEKRRNREERAMRAAMAAHQAAAATSLAGAPPAVSRRAGEGIGNGDFRLESFSVSNGGLELVEDATVILASGRKYGLIGRNGTGKTTLLRHVAAHAIPGIPAAASILHVEQEVSGGEGSVLQCVLDSDTERKALIDEAAALSGADADGDVSSSARDGSASGAAGERLAWIFGRMTQIDAYTAESRAAAILSGLAFDSEMQSRPTSTFSGGWRMRMALARALFASPDLLLLDEPTNHLDLHAVLWLEDYLCGWKGTVIIVSHSRAFLNAVCTDILHLHGRKIAQYRGDYDAFETARAERLRCESAVAEGNARQRAHIQEFIDKFRYNAKRASLVQSRIKALERMAVIELEEPDPEYVFRFPSPDVVAPPVMGFYDVAFGYPGRPPLFSKLTFGMDTTSRVCLVGANGAGKSTLLNLISGALVATSGVVQRNAKVRWATFNQHHVDGLDLALTPLMYLAKCFPLDPEQALRSHLGSFGLSGPLAVRPMYTLSGGQKSRVAFAKVTWLQPHMLLLDEPSNHLDLDAVDALIQGLTLFTGGILFCSHDEHLITACADELWVVANGAVSIYPGEFDDYKRGLLAALHK